MKKKDYEKIISDQKYYIQVLESTLNRAYVELADKKNLFEQTNQKIEKLHNDIDDLLYFIIHQNNENHKNTPISLQEYFRSFSIKGGKNLIFGIHIEQKFIKNSSIPTLQYHLYKNHCFIQKKYSFFGLVSKNKRDLHFIGKTFCQYLEFCFKQASESIIGIITLSLQEEEILIDYYGNRDIEREFQDFIKLYTKEESLENLFT
ncbi:hypothetical protein [Helicobacter mustelae]|uniref:Uncharacterized protein n=1 Tax=Helicobacter mustelae (strain ATCC 43772 / CCUG 25715 / CIP 103759 / LMG 18044 / NCTC 12198 / R85-136P) TaxID=679897 RepID=D3UFK6_HELM1|nr:hypothetical protein [Helicobacter mustelae]CBG39277.1 putative hypothetical protein [Helicobacter mustelae 12198]SQH70787.1 Uncharacterised protein [Helicobacter mustelae]STP11911.1 Uncharacterised protein [Helicobacter mustelae]STP14155.1 Uncharacterised protein [Helicobacter mustelae]